MKNFFGLLKQGIDYGVVYYSYEELKLEIERYIRYYNEQRIKEKATELVEEYKEQMDEATYKGAKEEIKNAKIKPQKED